MLQETFDFLFPLFFLIFCRILTVITTHLIYFSVLPVRNCHSPGFTLLFSLSKFFLHSSQSLISVFFLFNYTGRGNPRQHTAAPHDHNPSLMLWPKLSFVDEHCCGAAAPFTDPHTTAINLQKRQSVVLSGPPLKILINRSDLLNFPPSHLCCKLFFELIISKKTWRLTRAKIFPSFFLSNTIPKYSPVWTFHVKITHCVIFEL